MTRTTCFVALLMLTSMSVVSGSNGFLKTRAEGAEEHISTQEVQVSLLSEIEAGLGSGSAAKKLNELEAQLRPMYTALPKNEHGGLSHSVVRYALHRLFVQRHGWSVKGLDPAGGSFSSASPSEILTDQVPAYIQGLFEDRLHGKGMGLHELAVFAATIEHLIHNEAVGRLGDALNVHKILPTSPMTEVEADEVLDTYMMAYILGDNLTNMTLKRAQESRAEMPELYMAWKDTQTFMRDMRVNITAATQAHETNFATLAKVAEAAGEHFGSFQDQECREIKGKLLAMEDRGSGRVRLADFYKPALGGDWQFQESVSYLRSLGVLDESDPKDPSVMIANYLTSQSNCIASSGFYSVCCMDECEALQGHLEEQIAASEAPADRIAAIIANLPSSSVSAPRSLSSSLLQRLAEISSSHGGMVPIHGRLFAQWMHHAYPRECQYPHLSGTTNPQTEAQWVEKGQKPVATEDEMLEFCSPNEPVPATSKIEEVVMPWSPDEELLVTRASRPAHPASSTWSATRNFMLLSSLGSVMIALVRTFKSVESSECCDSAQKLFV